MRNVAVVLLVLVPGCSQPVEEIKPPDAQAIADAAAISVAEADWPWWRGTARTSWATGKLPPTEWSETTNVVWRAAVPGRGHATPVIWGDRIFVATADEQAETQSLIAYARDTGAQLWQCEIHRGGFMAKHDKNSHASATPACDGDHVFVCFAVQDGLWATAVDSEGKIKWQTKVGAFRPRHGFGSSPLLYRSLIIVAGDHEGSSYLVALDRRSGAIVWRAARHRGGSYATPVVADIAGRAQLLLHGQGRVTSYDPASGNVLWTCRGPSTVAANTIAWHDDLVFASGGYPQHELLCIRADGEGDVTSSHVVWKKDFKAYVPSPLVLADRLLVVRDNGVAICLAAGSGEKLWEKRLGGDFSASPVAIGDLVYVPNERGRMYVFRAGEQFQSVAENDLNDGGFASPAICDGRIYLRTEHRLYSIGETDG